MRLWNYLAAVLSGLILVFAYPNWNVGLAVWLWLLPLLGVLWQDAAPRRPFLLGWLAGVSFFVPNLWWLRHSSRVIAGALDHSWTGWGPELMGFGAVVGLSGYCSLYFGLWAWFACRVARPRQDSPAESLRTAFLCAMAWPACEWLRGFVLSGFGWDGLGVALHGNLALIQIADVVGVCGTSFLPVFVSCVMFSATRRLMRDFRHGRRFNARLEMAVTAGVLLVIAGYGIVKLREKPGDTIPLKTVMVQQNVPQAVKWAGETTPELYRQLADLTRVNAAKRDGAAPVDLVIWPESAVPVPLYAHPDHPRYFDEILSLGDFSLLTGAEIQEPGEPMFTSAVLMRGVFARQQHYHKVHLVPFGEFLPFRDTFPFSLLRGVLPGDFVPGSSTEPLKLEKPPIGLIPLICFEDTVGRLARKFVRDEPQLIVNLTNDGWFLQSAETEIHTANSIFRAIELRRPMARASNTGVTCVVDARGRMIARLRDPATGDTFIEGCLQHEIQVPAHPPRTLYARFGDWFSVLMLILCIGISIVQRRSPGGKGP